MIQSFRPPSPSRSGWDRLDEITAQSPEIGGAIFVATLVAASEIQHQEPEHQED
jgi:hypothetical protein